MISVIVPCYNESDNIRPLCVRVFNTIKNGELLIMDDESVGSERTGEVVRELQDEGYNIEMYRRKNMRGLSSAVLNGIRRASNEIIVVMDGDLQHEPETIPSLVFPVITNQYDMSVGSRNIRNMDRALMIVDWSIFRILMSWIATLLAWGLTNSSDPMSGFFCVKRSIVMRNMDMLNMLGFKIGLEIMVVCGCRVIDIPINFRKRLQGDSKLGIKQICLYLVQLCILYKLKLIRWLYKTNMSKGSRLSKSELLNLVLERKANIDLRRMNIKDLKILERCDMLVDFLNNRKEELVKEIENEVELNLNV